MVVESKLRWWNLSDNYCWAKFREEVELAADKDKEIFRDWSAFADAIGDIAGKVFGMTCQKERAQRHLVVE